MKLPVALAAFVITAGIAGAHAQGEPDQPITLSPEQLGQIFCIASLGNDMAPVEAMLTPALSAAIAEANSNESLAIRLAPDDKPPLGDGLPWRSVPDYADGCTVGAVVLHHGEASVEIHYSFSQYPDAAYTDALLLAQHDSSLGMPPVWRLDDIILANDQTFTGTLIAAFAE